MNAHTPSYWDEVTRTCPCADCRLMRAAPKLLEALKALAYRVENNGAGESEVGVSDVLEQARAAIAQAERKP